MKMRLKPDDCATPMFRHIFLSEIEKIRAERGCLLDIGCGYGFFLLEAKRNGWEVFGTELV